MSSLKKVDCNEKTTKKHAKYRRRYDCFNYLCPDFITIIGNGLCFSLAEIILGKKPSILAATALKILTEQDRIIFTVIAILALKNQVN